SKPSSGRLATGCQPRDRLAPHVGMDSIGETLGQDNALDEFLQVAPPSFVGEPLEDSVPCNVASGTRVGGPDCVCRGFDISHVDVETGVVYEGRDSGGSSPDRDAPAGHGLPQRTRESFVFRDLNVDASASVCLQEVANRSEEHTSELQSRVDLV